MTWTWAWAVAAMVWFIGGAILAVAALSASGVIVAVAPALGLAAAVLAIRRQERQRC